VTLINFSRLFLQFRFYCPPGQKGKIPVVRRRFRVVWSDRKGPCRSSARIQLQHPRNKMPGVLSRALPRVQGTASIRVRYCRSVKRPTSFPADFRSYSDISIANRKYSGKILPIVFTIHVCTAADNHDLFHNFLLSKKLMLQNHYCSVVDFRKS